MGDNNRRRRPYDYGDLSRADRMQIDRMSNRELRDRHRDLGPGRERDYIAVILARRAYGAAQVGDIRDVRTGDELRRYAQSQMQNLPRHVASASASLSRGERLQLRARFDARLAAERLRRRRAAEAIVVAAAAVEAQEQARRGRRRRDRRIFTGGMLSPPRQPPGAEPPQENLVPMVGVPPVALPVAIQGVPGQVQGRRGVRRLNDGTILRLPNEEYDSEQDVPDE